MGVRIETEGGRERTAADLAHTLFELERHAVTGPAATIATVAQDHDRSGVGERTSVIGIDHQAAQHLAEGRLYGQTQVGLDLETLGEAATAAGSSRAQHRFIGPGLELELDAARVGPFAMSVFGAVQSYRELGERRVQIRASDVFDDGTPANAQATFERNAWSFNGIVGVRFRWLPEAM